MPRRCGGGGEMRSTDWEALSEEASQDRRKGKRIPLSYRIEVTGFDRAGRLFAEHTTTSNISEEGCRFVVKTPLQRGDVVAIKLMSREPSLPPQNRSLLFQVAWIAREQDGWAVGALKLQPENIWHTACHPR